MAAFGVWHIILVGTLATPVSLFTHVHAFAHVVHSHDMSVVRMRESSTRDGDVIAHDVWCCELDPAILLLQITLLFWCERPA